MPSLLAGSRKKTLRAEASSRKIESCNRYRKLEHRAASFFAKQCSDPTAVLIYNHPANRQSQSHPSWFRRIKCVKNSLNLGRLQSGASIFNSDRDFVAATFGCQLQQAIRLHSRVHRFKGISDKIKNDLLQLATMSSHKRQPIGQTYSRCNAALHEIVL